MPHHDVDADLVYKFLDCSAGKSIDELSLCGDAGDSIYYPNLFYFIERFKPDKKIVIVRHDPASRFIIRSQSALECTLGQSRHYLCVCIQRSL